MNKLLKTYQRTRKFGLILICLFFLPSSLKAQYTINSVYTTLSSCDTMTRGNFIVWWDNDFNYATQADVMLDSLLAIRNTCLNDLNMQDPRSSLEGYYCNIYIHTPGNPLDTFIKNGWGNGVGGDVNGYPFMTERLNSWRYSWTIRPGSQPRSWTRSQ